MSYSLLFHIMGKKSLFQRGITFSQLYENLTRYRALSFSEAHSTSTSWATVKSLLQNVLLSQIAELYKTNTVMTFFSKRYRNISSNFASLKSARWQ